MIAIIKGVFAIIALAGALLATLPMFGINTLSDFIPKEHHALILPAALILALAASWLLANSIISGLAAGVGGVALLGIVGLVVFVPGWTGMIAEFGLTIKEISWLIVLALAWGIPGLGRQTNKTSGGVMPGGFDL